MSAKLLDIHAVNIVTFNAVISLFKNSTQNGGLSTKLIIENGKQFLSRQIDDLIKSFNIKHAIRAIYNSQANGSV